MKYPRGLRVVLLHHNLGDSIYVVRIGRALGWGVDIFGVLWSHILALRPAISGRLVVSCGNSAIQCGCVTVAMIGIMHHYECKVSYR